MAGAIVNVIGIVSGILGIISFGQDNFKAPDSVGSVVNIQVGLDYEGVLQVSMRPFSSHLLRCQKML